MGLVFILVGGGGGVRLRVQDSRILGFRAFGARYFCGYDAVGFPGRTPA